MLAKRLFFCYSMYMNQKNTITGGCLCGKVRFLINGLPIRTFACHCTFCQKVTGSSFYVESLFDKKSVKFNDGPLNSYEHVSDTSGKKVFAHFCPNCGSTIGLTFERWPEIHGISRGCLDNPNLVEITSHIWTKSTQTGTVLPADVDCFYEARASLDGSPNQPIKR